MQTDIDTIRSLNDAFRSNFQGGKIMLTRSVAQLSVTLRRSLIVAVQKFQDFDSDSDEYEFNEHDLAFMEFQGTRYMWKIDYYDSEMEYRSENPADSSVTTRVLTIMEASEY